MLSRVALTLEQLRIVTVPGPVGMGSVTETHHAPINIDKVIGLSISDVEREAAARRRRDALSPSRGG